MELKLRTVGWLLVSAVALFGVNACGSSSGIAGSEGGAGNSATAGTGGSKGTDDGGAGTDVAVGSDGDASGEGSDADDASGDDGRYADSANEAGDAVRGDTGNSDAACECFTHGNWMIDNLSPCLVSTSVDGAVTGVISSIIANQQIQCPTDTTDNPTLPWSTDKLTADCSGHYRLCYTLKAGNPASPQPTDCVVAQSCAEGDYSTANQSQTWPDLPGWLGTSAQVTCAQMFVQTGGYGEETVTGTPTGCAAITKTLSRVTYCPTTCNSPNPPASCSGCMPGGGGAF